MKSEKGEFTIKKERWILAMMELLGCSRQKAEELFEKNEKYTGK